MYAEPLVEGHQLIEPKRLLASEGLLRIVETVATPCRGESGVSCDGVNVTVVKLGEVPVRDQCLSRVEPQ